MPTPTKVGGIARLGVALNLVVAPRIAAQAGYVPTAENIVAREGFQDAKFGMFIHWGLYSVLQDGEWVMNNRGMRVAQGIRLFFCYSQLDWRHPDFCPRGQTGRTAGRPDSGQFSRYLDYMDAQLRELLSNYGPIGGIWFDEEWDRPVSNHHHLPRPGEDVQTFERDLPGRNTAGFNTTEIGALPLETAQTMNNSWGSRHGTRGGPITPRPWG